LALAPYSIQSSALPPQYTTELHSWFLHQIRLINPELSAYLHDGQSEKPFTISSLAGLSADSRSYQVLSAQTYRWAFTLLSQPVIQGIQQWLRNPPTQVNLRNANFDILHWEIAQPATTYQALLDTAQSGSPSLALQFQSPTSFRHKGNHLPLPMPKNLFHSYLRRWNDFSGIPIDKAEFLEWVDQTVIIVGHQLQSRKVMAGKQGSVTGFMGSIQLGLSKPSQQPPAFVQFFEALGHFAPYCGTGHKTTFGLGQTRLGWSAQAETAPTVTVQDVLAQRVAELTEQFIVLRKRTGGDRARNIAETWATILARREMGESLLAIAQDLEMPYETVKTYVKLARRSLKNQDTL
jgi:CRISPR-associated endoribonuclease Cas6